MKAALKSLLFRFSLTTDEKELQSRSFKNSLPTGIVSGDNLINLFNSLSVGYSDSIAFNELPIPFICIATNLINGEAEMFIGYALMLFEGGIAPDVTNEALEAYKQAFTEAFDFYSVQFIITRAI